MKLSKVPTIAIIGRPNVGKSALFNWLAGKNISIVHNQAGVTRDRISAPCKYLSFPCDLMDTGGIDPDSTNTLEAKIQDEAQIAIQSAEILLFIVDAKQGVTHLDRQLAQQLQSQKIPVLLIVNKVDTDKQTDEIAEFSSLGFGSGTTISVAHHRGLSELLQNIENQLINQIPQIKEIPLPEVKPSLKITLVGRPNAGKSSLINAILREDRTLVSEISGTTRDSIDIEYQDAGQHYLLIDTAGLRRRSKMDNSVEVFSSLRSERSIRRSDLCCLLIDASQGVTSMDRKIARTIQQEQKPCLIVVNKFDLFHPDANRKDRLKEMDDYLRRELFFLSYAPFVCLSAKYQQQLHRFFPEIAKIKEKSQDLIRTGPLNRLLKEAFILKPPPLDKQKKKRLKLLYATTSVNQKYTQIPVPTYILFVNDKRLMDDNYEHYLSNFLRQRRVNLGVPINFSVRSRDRTEKK